MDKLQPGKVVEMAVLASYHEACRHNGRFIGAAAIGVNITACLAPAIYLQLEQAGIDGGEAPAFRADHPAGECGNRHAGVGDLCVRIIRIAKRSVDGSTQTTAYLLQPRIEAHGCQQPCRVKVKPIEVGSIPGVRLGTGSAGPSSSASPAPSRSV